MHFSDRLAAAILARRSVVCVGLDPDLERMPPELVAKYAPQVPDLGVEQAASACIQEFCSGIIDAVAGVAACVKPQAAFFEQYGAAGWQALAAVVRCAQSYELPVIVDVKRGDISSTGRAYAQALFGGAPAFDGAVAPGLGADAVTVSPYLGERFADAVHATLRRRQGRVRAHAHEQPGCPATCRIGCATAGRSSCTWPTLSGGSARSTWASTATAMSAPWPAPRSRLSLRAVRAALPHAFLLVPGFGAQGGGAEALAGIASGEAAGYVVNASRSILYAGEKSGTEYRTAAAAAADAMRKQLGLGS